MNRALRFLLSWLWLRLTVRPREFSGMEAVRQQLRDQYPGLIVWALDDRHWLCSERDIERIAAWDWTDRRWYVAERYDCEDFAISFRSRLVEHFGINGVGLVIDWSTAHAYNVVVTSNGAILWWEPQEAQFVEPGQGLYRADNGYGVILL